MLLAFKYDESTGSSVVGRSKLDALIELMDREWKISKVRVYIVCTLCVHCVYIVCTLCVLCSLVLGGVVWHPIQIPVYPRTTTPSSHSNPHP
jgi:hypothetical protein